MPAGSTYTPIATSTLTSAAATFTFTSIPSTYTDLIIVLNGAITSGLSSLGIQYNSNGTGYSYTRLQGNGTTASSSRATGDDAVGFVAQDSCMTTIQINNYSNSTTYKTAISRTNSNYSSDGRTGSYVSLWQNTAAITSIRLATSSTFVAGTNFTLYGIASA